MQLNETQNSVNISTGSAFDSEEYFINNSDSEIPNKCGVWFGRKWGWIF